MYATTAVAVASEDAGPPPVAQVVSVPTTPSTTMGGGTSLSTCGPCGPDRSASARIATTNWGQSANEDEVMDKLEAKHGMPPALAKAVVHEHRRVSRRVFIVDNSGSMNRTDGCYINPRGEQVDCSRWEELEHMLLDHAALNVVLGVPTEFQRLNPPNAEPLEVHTVEDVRALKVWLNNIMPTGVTPLAECMRNCRLRLRTAASNFPPDSFAFVIIATDGKPTSRTSAKCTTETKEEMVNELRAWMAEDYQLAFVVRLCTQDPETLDFWNEIDAEYELACDVVAHQTQEANEIFGAGNSFFTYGLPLHRVREGGSMLKLLDALDEERLPASDAARLAWLLAGSRSGEQPSWRDADAFVRTLRTIGRCDASIIDPISKESQPWVHHKRLRAALSPGGGAVSSKACIVS